MKELQDYHLSQDPFENFSNWLKEAEKHPIENFNAMTLASCDPKGAPDARTVLYKGLQNNHLIFYTSYEGTKAVQLESNPLIAGVFYWHELGKQIRFKGSVSKLSSKQNDAYFQSRATNSQLAALISKQSSPISGQAELLKKFQEAQDLYKDKKIPTPANWGGYAIAIHEFEFFLHSNNRLNDRFLFIKELNSWNISRLQP